MPRLTLACLIRLATEIIASMLGTRFQVHLFLIIISVLALFTGQFFFGRPGLIFAFLAMVALNSAVFFFGENQILKKLKAKKMIGKDPWGLQQMISEICNTNQLPRPQIYLLQEPSALLFSLGVHPKEGMICISVGLLEKFKPDEIKMLLTRQVLQLQHTMSFGLSVVSTLASTLISTAETLDAFLPFQLLTSKNLKFFQVLVSPFVWLLLRLVIRQNQFLEVDIQAGELLKNRYHLGELLWKMGHLSKTRPFVAPPFTSHLFAVQPDTTAVKKWTDFHPNMNLRLQNLIGTPIP